MGVLTYSAISKAGKIISDQFSDADATKIVSLKVPIEYDEINLGSVFEIGLGELPAGSVLLQSQIEIVTIFRESVNSSSPRISVGLKTAEYDDTDLPVDYHKKLIFNDYHLNSGTGTYRAQGFLIRPQGYSITDSRSISKQINNTDNSIVAYINSLGVWSSGGTLNTARAKSGAFGTHGSAVICGGSMSGVSNSNTTENYNGTSWSNSNNMSTGRRYAPCCGTSDEGLVVAGTPSLTSCEEYNGSAWSGGGSISTATTEHQVTGAQTAAVMFGGTTGSPTITTEEYDGASWTTSNDMIQARENFAAGGVQTATFAVSGDNGVEYKYSTEEYNGTTWAIGNDSSIQTQANDGAGNISQGIISGGMTIDYEGTNIDYSQITEEYDGVGWTTGNNLITGRRFLSMCGEQQSCLSIAGDAGSDWSNVTEEYVPSSLENLSQGSLNLFITYSYQ